MARPSHFIVLVSLLASCAPGQSERCEIPVLVPDASAYQALAREIRRAKELVADSLAPRTLRLQFTELNTAGDPVLASTRVPTMAERENVPLVVGSLISTETHQFAERVVVELGKVVLANGSSDPAFTNLPWRRDGDGFFRNWPPDDAEATAMATYVLAHGYRRLAVLHAKDKYSAALTAAFVKTYQGAGGVLVAADRDYTPDTPDLSRILGPLSRLAFDAVYIIGLPRDVGQLYRGLRTGAAGRQNTAKMFFTGVSVEGADFRSVVGNTPIVDLVYSAPAIDKGSSAYRDFADQYSRRYNAEPDVFTAVAYDALRLAILAVDSGRSCTPAHAREYLHGLPTPFAGASGTTAFTVRGDVLTKDVAIRGLTKTGSDLLELRRPATNSNQ